MVRPLGAITLISLAVAAVAQQSKLSFSHISDFELKSFQVFQVGTITTGKVSMITLKMVRKTLVQWSEMRLVW